METVQFESLGSDQYLGQHKRMIIFYFNSEALFGSLARVRENWKINKAHQSSFERKNIYKEKNFFQ